MKNIIYTIQYEEVLFMALIKCPECGKEISDRAGACPNCGCPIADAPTSVKVRALSNDHGVRRTKFKIGNTVVAEVPIGATATINITKPTVITISQHTALMSYSSWTFTAVPGKCYEALYCKPGMLQWTTKVTEVSFIG